MEGGNYISPELQSGAVFDGDGEPEETIIYQPVYVCVPHKGLVMKTPSALEIKRHQPPQIDTRKSTTVETVEIEVPGSRVSSL